jgi:HSF-type DNA-binding
LLARIGYFPALGTQYVIETHISHVFLFFLLFQKLQLMEILDDPQNAEIVAWLPHGGAFVIYRKREFAADLLPKYFQKFSKYSSFTRKLNRWGFVRVTRGPETGAYYHRLFRRNESRLILQMTCHSSASHGNNGNNSNAANTTKRVSSSSGSSVSRLTEPSEMPMIHPSAVDASYMYAHGPHYPQAPPFPPVEQQHYGMPPYLYEHQNGMVPPSAGGHLSYHHPAAAMYSHPYGMATQPPPVMDRYPQSYDVQPQHKHFNNAIMSQRNMPPDQSQQDVLPVSGFAPIQMQHPPYMNHPHYQDELHLVTGQPSSTEEVSSNSYAERTKTPKISSFHPSHLEKEVGYQQHYQQQYVDHQEIHSSGPYLECRPRRDSQTLSGDDDERHLHGMKQPLELHEHSNMYSPALRRQPYYQQQDRGDEY